MDYLRRAWAEIDLCALKHNFEVIKKAAAGAEIMAVVKADAYGHCAKTVAPALEEWGADWFAVSNINEALELRDYNIKKPIFILGYTPPECAAMLKDNGVSQCVYSYEYAKALSDMAVKQGINVKIHLKLDTGMGRLGFDCRRDSLNGMEEAVKSAKLPNLMLEGTFMHFAVADRKADDDGGFTDAQHKRFVKAIEILKQSGLNPKTVHCCNSAATLKDKEKHHTLVRPGIILYGLTPDKDFDRFENLIPVMTFKSIVSFVKTIKAGETVSYGRTFTAEKDMLVATVSAGYADGYPRMLSNKSYVFINGKKAKVLGRICMDQIVIDATGTDAKMGDEAELFGKNISVTELAGLADTINYEIVCNVSKRVPRVEKGEL